MKGLSEAEEGIRERKRPSLLTRLGVTMLLSFGILYALLKLVVRSDLVSQQLTLSPEFSEEQLRNAILESVQPSSIDRFAKHYMTSGPHLLGQSEALANWTADKFTEFGFPEVSIETYDVYANYPVSHSVSIDGKKLSLKEDKLDEDETTRRNDSIPTFHGYSASGTAEGEVIYANYGRKSDYDRLVANGVNLTNKIVICRYGGIFRGLKVKFAEELGAKGVLIYSDPGDDGEVTEKNGYKPYPEGPARNPSSVQRGSVQDLSHAPGDPTTPGYPSIPGDPHEDPRGIPSIPSIPLSYVDALPILKSLKGRGIQFSDWVGGLDGVDYSVGPSKAVCKMTNEQDYGLRPNRNVIAVLPGESSSKVILGNHRDAWIVGGADPNSGSASFLEVARALGNLYTQGWRPKRTLVFASWDGEEYGLVGSTEHGEDHAEELKASAYAYLNCDVSCSGPSFKAEANPLLEKALKYALKYTPAPREPGKVMEDIHSGHYSPLGSGSDYTVFQDHLGVASVDFGFSPNSTSPVYHYHSNFDSYNWMVKFGDPGFDTHAAASKIHALMTVFLSESQVIPLDPVASAKFLRKALKPLLKESFQIPGISHPILKHLLKSSGKLEGLAHRFERIRKGYESALDREWHWWEIPRKRWLEKQLKNIDERLRIYDQCFIYSDGLEDRPWFKHIIFAPGRYTGYAGQVFPGIAESLEDSDGERLEKWLNVTSTAIDDAITVLKI